MDQSCHLTDVSPPGSVREWILSTLGKRILGGHYPEGAALPIEADLCAEFDVSRTVLREAVKMLTAKGLLVSRKRAGTLVRSASNWNRLDADVLSWMGSLDPDPVFVRGLLEARLAIEPASARLAAMHSTSMDLATIEAAYHDMRTTPADDLAGRIAADVAFHIGILEASHNPVFAGLGKLIKHALEDSFRLTTRTTESYSRALRAHGDVLEAIRLRQPDIASERMRALVDVAMVDLLHHLAMVGTDSPGEQVLASASEG
ncbi:FadR/GntR family transcriptional regulator [Devosia algicola]|uniref:FadR/GntR family transcriptional regulator n=1 Tax=Devosia algicola TaxID=3026418 RepID=A0ABY7YQA1_9HYPH|nr:FadR/GntR family transcriptional regulator [Devosia algicola]WDR03075.1 FadR/GntR family transcriptional regulator [Devosia algicola]